MSDTENPSPTPDDTLVELPEERVPPFGAFDGYRLVEDGNELQLGLQLGGRSFGGVLLKGYSGPAGVQAAELADTASRHRLANVLEVVAGYLNTGGTIEDLQQVLEIAKPFCEQHRVELPEGWKLMDWNLGLSPDQYLFVHEGRGLVCIVEPEDYAEVTTITEFAQSEGIERPAGPAEDE